MVDKNLFLYDLAVVSILKNEAPYLKEWLDYHLIAGVNHFYLYDNDSTDNQAEVAKPYVAAGLVDYMPAPGKFMQMQTYNDAAKRFKFHCRYIAFIDGDEFIYPRSERSIVEVVDEILSGKSNAATLAVNLHAFGSAGQEKADLSHGVLERFMRRAPNDWAPDGMGNAHVSTIANPRMISHMTIPHFAFYFEGVFAVNENGGFVGGAFNNPVTAEKIVMNHYSVKSREEYAKKVSHGAADHNTYHMENFDINDRNEEFDDGILKYRAARAENFSLESDTDKLNRVTEALTETLLAYAEGATSSLETALTCRALSAYLRENFPGDADIWQICEKASLGAVLKSLQGISFADSRLFVRELPNLLSLPYPETKDLRKVAAQIIPQMMTVMRTGSMWRDFVELDYTNDLLKTGG